MSENVTLKRSEFVYTTQKRLQKSLSIIIIIIIIHPGTGEGGGGHIVPFVFRKNNLQTDNPTIGNTYSLSLTLPAYSAQSVRIQKRT